MPNCDWNRPCDCKDCRTVFKTIICPNCGFSNVVSILRDTYDETDKKGIRGYRFEIPNKPALDLTCFKCGYVIKEVGYYTEVDQEGCKRNILKAIALEQGKICATCEKVEGFDYVSGYGLAKLQNHNGKLLCQECLSNTLMNQILDPSNENEKYEFDKRKSNWILTKIKIECVDCGKKRWVNAENRWKTRCITCFKKTVK